MIHRFYEIHHQDGSVGDMILIEGVDPHEEIMKWPAEQRATVAHIQAVTAFRDRSHEVAHPTFANVPDDVKTAILEMGEAMNALHGRSERQAEELSELRDFKARYDATMGDKS